MEQNKLLLLKINVIKEKTGTVAEACPVSYTHLCETVNFKQERTIPEEKIQD